MWRALLCGLVWIAVPPAAGGEFGQWRGPQRNGVAADGPPLAVSWSKGGPARLWQSEKIPAGESGGFSCVAVARGRAYLYVNQKYSVPIEQRKLTTAALRQLGWFGRKVPQELVDAVEPARLSDARAKLKGKELTAWVQKWLEENLKDAEQKKHFGPFAADRLKRGKAALPLEVLAKLEAIKDKAFANQAALEEWFAGSGIGEALKKTILRVIPTTVQKAWDIVYCLDAANGKTLWQKKYDGRPHAWSASSTPCVAGGRVYAAGSDGMVYCLRADYGEELWKVKVARGGGLIHSSVMVAEGIAVVLADQLAGLDAETGEPLWQQKKVRGRENSPVCWQSAGRAHVICNTGKALACVALKSGDLMWTVPGGGQSTAAVAGDLMAVFSADKKVGLTVYKLSAEKPEKIWSKPEHIDGAASPVIHDGHLYAVGKDLAVCVDLSTRQVAWENKKIGGNGHTSPVLADGKLFAVVGRQLLVIDAAPEKFNVLASAKLPVAEYASPVVAGGRLYLRLGNAVACYDLTRPTTQPATGP